MHNIRGKQERMVLKGGRTTSSTWRRRTLRSQFSLHHHQGRQGVPYSMSVTGTFREPLDRQIMEKVQISRFEGDILMNRKNELGVAILEREKYKYRRWR